MHLFTKHEIKIKQTKKLFNYSIHHSSKFIYIKVLYKFSSLPFSLYTNLQFHQNTKSQVLYNNARVHTDLYKSSTKNKTTSNYTVPYMFYNNNKQKKRR